MELCTIQCSQFVSKPDCGRVRIKQSATDVESKQCRACDHLFATRLIAEGVGVVAVWDVQPTFDSSFVKRHHKNLPLHPDWLALIKDHVRALLVKLYLCLRNREDRQRWHAIGRD